MMNHNAKTSNFCPYRGLEPYTEEYRRYFFGRESDQKTIASNLHAMPLTVLYGNSGVGKSSVLMAGVVPQLKQTARLAVVVFRNWQGDGFVHSLKQEVLHAVNQSVGSEINVDLSLPFDKFLRACNEALDGPIFFIFDQFEEYFLYHPPSKADDSFDADFARVINRRDLNARFLLSMRGEELSKLDRFRGRIPNILANMLRLSHLDRAAGARVIREPLVEYNCHLPADQHIKIEDELVTELLDKSIPYQRDFIQSRSLSDSTQDPMSETGIETPVLQILLTRLWKEEIGQGSNTLRLSTYKEKLYGAESIISSYLNEVMERLTEPERAAAASLFRFLVTPSRTKIAQEITSLASWVELDEGQVEAVLLRLSSQEMRVLRTVRATKQPVRYEIFHDVLARAILDWRAAYVQAQEQARAADLAAEEAAREAKEAARQLQLEQAQALAAAERQSAEEQKRRVEYEVKSGSRLRRLSTALALVTLIALGTAVFAGVKSWQTISEGKRAHENERLAMAAREDAKKEAALAKREAERANNATADAEGAQRKAEEQAKIANEAMTQALASKNTAEIQRKRAEEQAMLAAQRQQEVIMLQKLGTLYQDTFHALPKGNSQALLDNLEKIRSIYQQKNDRDGEISTLVFLGAFAETFEDDKEKAINYYERMLVLAKAASYPYIEFTALQSIAARYYELNDNRKAIEFYKQSVTIAKREDQKENVAGTLRKIGDIYFQLNEQREWISYYKQTLEVYRQLESKSDIASTLRLLGDGYGYLGDLEPALDYFNQALNIYREIKDESSTADTFAQIGENYKEIGENQKALEYYTQALQIYQKLKESLNEAKILRILAKIHRSLGHNEKSAELYRQAEKVEIEKDKKPEKEKDR